MQALPPHRRSDRHRALRLKDSAHWCMLLLRAVWVNFELATLREGICRHR
jgi:hypothetical protein